MYVTYSKVGVVVLNLEVLGLATVLVSSDLFDFVKKFF
jgi:hypothetical protein